jgi:hypothetical protein
MTESGLFKHPLRGSLARTMFLHLNRKPNEGYKWCTI